MTYVALLRAINVGGNRMIKMTALREMFEAAGATNVVTYIASGNVVFEHAERKPTTLTAKLEQVIGKRAGFAVPVILRTARELGALIEANPFAGEPDKSLHVLCLPMRVTAAALPAIDPKKFAPERFVLVGRELYVCLPDGVGRSPLIATLTAAKGLAGGTLRTWRTMLKLHELATRT